MDSGDRGQPYFTSSLETRKNVVKQKVERQNTESRTMKKGERHAQHGKLILFYVTQNRDVIRHRIL
jgi:hypothetical protein